MPAQGRWMSAAKLRALFNAGLTYDEIAEQNERSEGWRPSRSGVKRKYEAMGMPPRRPSNKELTPWNVRSEHNPHLFRHMLAAESRRRRRDTGESLEEISDTDRKLLARMHDLLWGRGTAMVFDYDPETVDGFSLVLRRDDDTDIIRAPRNINALRIELQAALRAARSDQELVNIAVRDGIRPEVLESMGRRPAADRLRTRLSEPSTEEPGLDDVRSQADDFAQAVKNVSRRKGSGERSA